VREGPINELDEALYETAVLADDLLEDLDLLGTTSGDAGVTNESRSLEKALEEPVLDFDVASVGKGLDDRADKGRRVDVELDRAGGGEGIDEDRGRRGGRRAVRPLALVTLGVFGAVRTAGTIGRGRTMRRGAMRLRAILEVIKVRALVVHPRTLLVLRIVPVHVLSLSLIGTERPPPSLLHLLPAGTARVLAMFVMTFTVLALLVFIFVVDPVLAVVTVFAVWSLTLTLRQAVKAVRTVGPVAVVEWHNVDEGVNVTSDGLEDDSARNVELALHGTVDGFEVDVARLEGREGEVAVRGAEGEALEVEVERRGMER
jgi:hypothetical protein